MKLADAFAMIVPPERGVGFRAYDGSTSGPQDSDVVMEVRSPRAVEYLAGSPNQLGLARAYVSGDLEIVGDVYDALLSTRVYREAWSHARAIALLREGADRSFDRRCVDALERVLAKERADGLAVAV